MYLSKECYLRQEWNGGPDDAVGEPVALRVDFRAAVGAHLVTEEVGISHETGDGAFRAQIRLGRLLTPRRKYLHMVTPANQIQIVFAGFGWVNALSQRSDS